jgi:uncharacterized protein (TIGR02118 family)
MSEFRKSTGSQTDAPVLHSRRDVLQSAGSAVTLGVLATAFGAAVPERVRADDAGVKKPQAMTILYPAGAGIEFDPDYYRDHHLKTIMSLYGNSIKRFELRTVPPMPVPAIAPPAGAPPPPNFSAAVNIWIADFAAFTENNRKHGPELVADVPHFTNAQSTIQFDDVYGMMGEPASAMKVGDTCLTIVYPNSDTVRWDVEYYKEHHMPLIMRLYGADAIKRFELRKGGAGQTGGPPKYIGSVNIYINDQKAFDAAGKKHGPALVADVPHFSSVMPIAFPTTLYGVG